MTVVQQIFRLSLRRLTVENGLGIQPFARHRHDWNSQKHDTLSVVGPVQGSGSPHYSEENLEGFYHDILSPISSKEKHSASPPSLSYKEWFETVRYLSSRDKNGVFRSLETMLKSGLNVPPGLASFVMEDLADSGRVAAFEAIQGLFCAFGKPIDSAGVHLHVKAYVRNGQIERACGLIHSYEERNIMPQLKTYSFIIRSLLTYARSDFRALAWDMFSHMRYVAHPVPDAQLYSVMLKACADAPTPQAERALDLFAEMSTDHQIRPTREAYNSTILACAKSRNHLHGAFQLAQEMLELFRSGDKSLKPDQTTFVALLECTKRNGDLRRAKWILFELTRAHQSGDDSLTLDDRVLSNVFLTYASYRPRPMHSLRHVGDRRPYAGTRPEPPLQPPSPPLRYNSRQPLSSVALPATREEVLLEASSLFSQFLDSRDASNEESRSLYWNVPHSTHLLNAYLCVVLAHSSLSKAKSIFDQIFQESGVTRSDRSYQLILERCAHPRTSAEKREVLPVAQSIWREWTDEGGTGSWNVPLARTVTKMWAAMIRVCALAMPLMRNPLSAEDYDGAMQLLREFAMRYPPSSVLHRPDLRPSSEAARTCLAGPRRLVRLTSDNWIPDDTVPPYLLFDDLETLHHRLLVANRLQDIGYIKWLTTSYQYALKSRREQCLTVKERS
ncbi:uncharacterized protein EI90DRAFT_3289113 [Cantharellus anzutake]|uniref:uncharacterized protein n=1 Tax=Cantharellus anzutake TaxID=1750568 RepID=UPI001905A9B5|nr:uncharacterized protein EI90DRAFT_3289113 [Cantharellus anzutake]KAF8331837.1 hypothetical protein EI90DRAFT_3289113 [Cantharellus anzutake]